MRVPLCAPATVTYLEHISTRNRMQC
jgi:hypothetical protein